MDQALLADENVEDGPLATVSSYFKFQNLICFYLSCVMALRCAGDLEDSEGIVAERRF